MGLCSPKHFHRHCFSLELKEFEEVDRHMERYCTVEPELSAGEQTKLCSGPFLVASTAVLVLVFFLSTPVFLACVSVFFSFLKRLYILNVRLVAPYCKLLAHTSVRCTGLSGYPAVPTSVVPGTWGGPVSAGWLGGVHVQHQQDLWGRRGQVLRSPDWKAGGLNPLSLWTIRGPASSSW